MFNSALSNFSQFMKKYKTVKIINPISDNFINPHQSPIFLFLKLL